MAFDLFRKRQVPGNWALTTLGPRTSDPKIAAPLAPTPNKAIDYLTAATDLAKTTDVSVSKSSFNVKKKFTF
jgi:hypothetical protein